MATCGRGFNVPSKILVIVTEQSAGNEHVCQHEITGFSRSEPALVYNSMESERGNHAVTAKSGKGGSSARGFGVQEFGPAGGTRAVRDTGLCRVRFRSLRRR